MAAAVRPSSRGRAPREPLAVAEVAGLVCGHVDAAEHGGGDVGG